MTPCASPTCVQRDLAVDPEITGVTADSRKVQPGLPVRRPARAPRPTAAASCPQALAAGAAAVLAGDDVEALAAPVVQRHDPRRAYALAAAAFWGAQPETCVAVTGTNGKTSVAAFCRQIFAAARPQRGQHGHARRAAPATSSSRRPA